MGLMVDGLPAAASSPPSLGGLGLEAAGNTPNPGPRLTHR